MKDKQELGQEDWKTEKAFPRQNPLCDNQGASQRVMFGKQVAPSNYSIRWVEGRRENEAEGETVASATQRALEVINDHTGHEDDRRVTHVGCHVAEWGS